MKNIIYILILITFNSQGQTNESMDVMTIEDKSLIQSMQKALQKSSWDFDSEVINTYKNNISRLENLYLLFKNQKASPQKATLALYIGGLHYLYLENYKKATQYLLQAYENKNQLSNPSATMFLYASLGDLEKAQHNYINSIYFYNKGLNHAINTKNYIEQYRTYRELGVNYRDIGAYDLAKRNLLQANTLIEKAKITKQDKVWMNIHLGRLYRLTKAYEKAKKQYKDALESDVYKQSPRIEVYALQEYSILLHELKQTDSTAYYCHKIIDMVNNNNNNPDITEKYSKSVLPLSYIFLAEINLQNNNPKKAIKLYNQAFKIGKSINVVEDTRKAAKWLAQYPNVDSKLKREALNYLDTSYSQQRTNNSLYLQLSHDYIKAVKSDFDFKIDTSNSKYNTINFGSLSIAVILFIFISVLIIKQHHTKAKQNKQLVKTNKAVNYSKLMLIGHQKRFTQLENTSQDIVLYISQIISNLENQTPINLTLQEPKNKLKLVKFLLNKNLSHLNSQPLVKKENIFIHDLFQNFDSKEITSINHFPVKIHLKINTNICLEGYTKPLKNALKNLLVTLIEYAITSNNNQVDVLSHKNNSIHMILQNFSYSKTHEDEIKNTINLQNYTSHSYLYSKLTIHLRTLSYYGVKTSFHRKNNLNYTLFICFDKTTTC